jgi:hypothetical protein
MLLQVMLNLFRLIPLLQDARQPDLLVPPPGRDGRIVAAQKHRRHGLALVDRRPGVLGVFRQALRSFEALTHGVLDHPRQQADDGVADGDHGGFPTRQDEIPQRKFLVHVIAYPGIHPLVMAAEEDQTTLPGQPVGSVAVKTPARGGKEDAMSLPDGLQGLDHGRQAQDHAGPAPVGRIVHVAEAAAGVVPHVQDAEVKQAQLLGPVHHVAAGKAGQVLGRQGAYSDVHGLSFPIIKPVFCRLSTDAGKPLTHMGN